MQTTKNPNSGSKRTVQNWVNSLLDNNNHLENKELANSSMTVTSSGTKMTSEEDDLLLGAEAKSVVHQNFEEIQCVNDSSGNTADMKGLVMTGKEGRSTADGETVEDMNLNVDNDHMKQQISLPHQDSLNSEASHVSVNSLDQILEERKGDPEMILQNLGFSDSYSALKCRIPDRFLLTPSKAHGISVEKFLEGNPKLREYLEEKSAIQNPFEMMMTSAQVPCEKRKRSRTGSNTFYQAALAMTVVNRFKRLLEKGSWASHFHGGVPIAEAVLQETPRGCRYWSVLPEENRSYLERSGYYDELWSAVSVASETSENSEPTLCCTAGKTVGAESTSPRLLCVACDMVTKHLHKGQEIKQSSTNANTKDSLMFSWSEPNGTVSSVKEAERKPESTQDMHPKGDGPPFQPHPSAKDIPGRFLASHSALVPNHLMTFNKSKLDQDVQHSVSEHSTAVIRINTELPTTKTFSVKQNNKIMQSAYSCKTETVDCADQVNRMTSNIREANSVSAAMDLDVSGNGELLQPVIDMGNNNRSLISSSKWTVFETNGISQDQKSSTVLSFGGNKEPRNCAAASVPDRLEVSSAAVAHSDTAAASGDILHYKSTARKERFCLRNFKAFSLDVAETCSSNDSKTASTISGRSRLKDDLRHQLSIQSDSSGFAEGDQLDAVSLLSVNDALAPSNRLLGIETPRLKDASCSQYFRSSVSELPDFMHSKCTPRPLSEGSDDCFLFSEPTCTIPDRTTSTQTDPLDVSSSFPHRYFSEENTSHSAATCRSFEHNLLSNGASSNVTRETVVNSDDLPMPESDSVSDGCITSGINTPKQYRTEVRILVNQTHSLETPGIVSLPSPCDLLQFNASSCVKMDVMNPNSSRTPSTSVIFRSGQSSPARNFGQMRGFMDSLDRHQSGSVQSSPVKYRSNSVSFQPNQNSSVRDLNQTRSLRDSFDLQESHNRSGRVQLNPSGNDTGSASVTCDIYEEFFLDVSEHQMLQDHLKNSGFVSPQSLPSFIQQVSWPTTSAAKWTQYLRDELKLMDFALQKYKLQNKLLHMRMCKAINSSGCRSSSSSQGVFLYEERNDLDVLEILHNEIMQELDEMEELLMQKLKRFLHSCAHEEHLLLSDFTSKSILQSMNQLLHEQDYQSNIVNIINSTGSTDHLSNSSPIIATSVTPPVFSPSPLLFPSVPMVSLQQLGQCLASVEVLLSEIQRKTDVMENCTLLQQPVQQPLDQTKELKQRKSYHRFLPTCLKPQWPKKRPVFKKQMSVPNIKKEDQ